MPFPLRSLPSPSVLIAICYSFRKYFQVHRIVNVLLNLLIPVYMDFHWGWDAWNYKHSFLMYSYCNSYSHLTHADGNEVLFSFTVMFANGLRVEAVLLGEII